ncbi:DNA repair protein RecO [Soonwooa sp.]|uniref:DNA repair protein RecO n=1 Tax=Soonwooa sp. TaxID=1938592 RepID=UPI00262FDE60|nr:DNA repair protein RecO [Soonwooa sp.]
MEIYKGFLLSYVRYGDNDAILHCYTEESAYLSFYIRGIYTIKNKKKAYLFPLNEIALSTNKGKFNSELLMTSNIESVSKKDLYQDIKANAIIFFVADLLNQILRHENEAQPKLYDAISEFLSEVELSNMQAHLVLMLKIIKIQGWAPLESEANYLNPETGNFVNSEVHYLFDKENSMIWKAYLHKENPYDLILNRDQRQKFLDSLLVYYHFHFVDFKTPKSLEIIQDIF